MRARAPPHGPKQGVKRSLLTDGGGIPLALAVAGANRHDMKLAEDTLTAIAVPRPDPTAEAPQHLCLDTTIRRCTTWRRHGATRPTSRRGVDPQARPRIPGYRARRWVVERTHSWLNRFRRLLIRRPTTWACCTWPAPG